jgi:hypothetical protein
VLNQNREHLGTPGATCAQMLTVSDERLVAPVTRPPATAGYTITVKAGRIYLVDQDPGRSDCRISTHEARELAQRLLCAAAAAELAKR